MDDIKECEERYNKALKVNNITKQAAVKLGVDLLEVYEKVVWPLAQAYGEESKAYDAFMIASENPDDVFSKIDIDPAWKEVFIEQIRKRMGAKELKIVARFELTCYSEDGIESIKRVLIDAKNRANKNDKGLEV